MRTIIDNIQIKAVSSWLPEQVLEMLSLSSVYGENAAHTIINTTGINRVRIAEQSITSADMCQKAAEILLEKENFDKNEIDGLVFVSQTKDYILPSTAVCLQHKLGLSKDIVCIDIDYGCSGYIYGLFQAAAWIKCGACSNVLVLAGDTTSRLINEMDRSSRMVFGECGTATLVSSGNSRIGFVIHSDGEGAERLIVPAGGFRLPKGENTSVVMTDEDGNQRTKNDLFMDGMEIFRFAIVNAPKNIGEVMELMGWNKDEVGLFALHQANKLMVDFIRKKIRVASNLVPINCSNYGNTGPSTIPLLLSDVCSQNNAFDLQKVVMSGFGVGLSWGSVATDLSYTHFYEPINK